MLVSASLLMPNEFTSLDRLTNSLSLMLLTKLRTSKPIETYPSFSSFKGQTTMEFWWNSHCELPAVLLDSNWLRRNLSTFLQIGDCFSYYLANTVQRSFWCGG